MTFKEHICFHQNQILCTVYIGSIIVLIYHHVASVSEADRLCIRDAQNLAREKPTEVIVDKFWKQTFYNRPVPRLNSKFGLSLNVDLAHSNIAYMT